MLVEDFLLAFRQKDIPLAPRALGEQILMDDGFFDLSHLRADFQIRLGVLVRFINGFLNEELMAERELQQIVPKTKRRLNTNERIK